MTLMRSIALILLLFICLTCRDGLIDTDDINPNSFWFCDTVNIKYNPGNGETTCTVRCTDKDGNEYIKYIDCNDLP